MTDMVRTLLNGTYEIVLPKHRADRPDWYTPEGWERARLDAMHNVIGPGDVVYYVGAEEGEFPALCQLWGAEVAMFEPNPLVWPNIKAIWDANNLATPMCWSGFAADITDAKQQTLGGWPPSANGPVIGNHGFKNLWEEGTVYPRIRLDDVARQWKPPTVVTFDVEGSEFQVMRGATYIAEEVRPTFFASIHPEFMFGMYGEYSRDFRNFFKDRAYKETILAYDHELHCMYEPL